MTGDIPRQGVFNLWYEPWLPVRHVDGRRGLVSLSGALITASTIADIDSPNPLANAVALRFLVALYMRTQGAPLEDGSVAAWVEWSKGRLDSGVDAKKVASYGNSYQDRFWLLGGDAPFLQDPAIATECDKRSGTNKLVMARASGNNPLFWTKVPDSQSPPLSHADAALELLAQWGYGAGGTCASRRKVSKGVAGLLRPLTIFILRGQSLAETLALNAIADPSLVEDSNRDACVWEQAPGASPGLGVLSQLTASPQGLLLFGDAAGVTDAVLTWGAKVDPALISRDQYAAFWKPSKKAESSQAPYKVRADNMAWKELPAILGAPSTGARPMLFVRPPFVLSFASHPLRSHESCLLERAAVTCTSHLTGQAKDVLSTVSTFPSLLSLSPGANYQRSLMLARATEAMEQAVESLKQACLEVAGEPLKVAETLEHLASHGPLSKKDQAAGLVTTALAMAWKLGEDAFQSVVATKTTTAAADYLKEVGTLFDRYCQSATLEPRRAIIVASARQKLQRSLRDIAKEKQL